MGLGGAGGGCPLVCCGVAMVVSVVIMNPFLTSRNQYSIVSSFNIHFLLKHCNPNF